MQNDTAKSYANYLRSRIRLTRALSTLIPGISLSLLLMLIMKNSGSSENAVPSWLSNASVVVIPSVYMLAFSVKCLLKDGINAQEKVIKDKGIKRFFRYI